MFNNKACLHGFTQSSDEDKTHTKGSSAGVSCAQEVPRGNRCRAPKSKLLSAILKQNSFCREMLFL